MSEEVVFDGGEVVYDDEVLENTQITNPEPSEVQTITRVKKPRSEKQLKALERARAKRLENLEKKKAQAELDAEFLKESEMSGGGGVSMEIKDFEEPVEPPAPRPVKKQKKKKKVIVNNYYEESSEEEEEEVVNNYYYGKKKKVNINDTPQQIQYEPADDVEYEVNTYKFNPYDNMRFV